MPDRTWNAASLLNTADTLSREVEKFFHNLRTAQGKGQTAA
jgi:hypothetical protein